MAGLDSSRLRRWADELDAEERAEKEQALEAKVDRLEAQLANTGLSAEDRALLEQARERLAALEDADRRDPDADDDPDDDAGSSRGGRRSGSGRTAPAGKRTRPGRKSGAAYDWTVDDDGNVVKSATAVIYTGADEPDEVDLPDNEGDED